MVSACNFRIIKAAIKIRLRNDEDTLENLVKVYTKLSDEQAQELINYYTEHPVIAK